MLNHIRENNRTYVTFDNPKAKALAQSDPDLFFETYPYPILIDEFQKVPSILEKIKEIVDKLALDGKDNNGLFWLTGSQKFKMMKMFQNRWLVELRFLNCQVFRLMK